VENQYDLSEKAVGKAGKRNWKRCRKGKDQGGGGERKLFSKSRVENLYNTFLCKCGRRAHREGHGVEITFVLEGKEAKVGIPKPAMMPQIQEKREQTSEKE